MVVEKNPLAELRPELSLFDATMIVVGATIGAGIFTTTGAIIQQVASPWGLIAVWVFGGILSLAGALTLAEMGAAMPKAGGDYVYLTEAYGSLGGFLCGWTSFLVTFSGSIAVLAVGLVEHASSFLPVLSLRRTVLSLPLGFDFKLMLSTGHGVALACVWLLTWINYRGLHLGSRVQDVLSVLKIGVLFSLVVFGLTVGRGTWQNFLVQAPVDFSMKAMSAFGLAMIPTLFAYNGWNAAIYVGSEIKNPQLNMTRALAYGTSACAVVYILVNVTFVYAMPVHHMQGVVAIGDLAARSLFGPIAATYVSMAIFIAMLSCMNAMILTGARIYYAMAKDGLFFRTAAKIHPRYRTPGPALWQQALCTSVLVVTGTFQQLITYVVFAIVLFSAITGVAVFVLRRKQPLMPRPYKTWGYPVIPALFVLSNAGLAINVLFGNFAVSLSGLLIVAAGIPAYLYWRNQASR